MFCKVANTNTLRRITHRCCSLNATTIACSQRVRCQGWRMEAERKLVMDKTEREHVKCEGAVREGEEESRLQC
eukprot:1865808-Rhodomonas_salina.1